MTRFFTTKSPQVPSKLQIGNPILNEPINTANTGRLHDLDIPAHTKPVSSETQIPFSLQDSGSDSSQHSHSSQSKVLSPLSSNPVNSLTESFRKPLSPSQANLTQPAFNKEVDTVNRRRPVTSYYPEENVSPAFPADSVDPPFQRFTLWPAQSYTNGDLNVLANPHSEDLPRVRSVSESLFNPTFHLEELPDKSFGEHLFRKASLRQQKGSLGPLNLPNNTNMFNEQRSQKTTLQPRKTTFKPYMNVFLAAIIAFTFAGSIFSFVKISQLESGNLVHAVTSEADMSPASRIIETVTTVKTMMFTATPASCKTSHLTVTPIRDLEDNPHANSIPAKPRTFYSPPPDAWCHSSETSWHGVHYSINPQRRDVGISTPTTIATIAGAGSQPTQAPPTLTKRSDWQTRIIIYTATSTGGSGQQRQIPSWCWWTLVPWAVIISLGSLFTMVICGTAVYEFIKYKDVLQNPLGAAHDELRRYTDEVVQEKLDVVQGKMNETKDDIKKLFDFKNVMEPVKETVDKIKNKLHFRRSDEEEVVIVTMTPSNAATPTTTVITPTETGEVDAAVSEIRKGVRNGGGGGFGVGIGSHGDSSTARRRHCLPISWESLPGWMTGWDAAPIRRGSWSVDGKWGTETE